MNLDNEHYYLELYENFFANSEIDDFGMNKKNFKKEPHFLESGNIKILQFLISNYFNNESDINNLNDSEKVYECMLCKKNPLVEEKITEKSCKLILFTIRPSWIFKHFNRKSEIF